MKQGASTLKLFRAPGTALDGPELSTRRGSVLEHGVLCPRHRRARRPAAELFAEAESAVPRGALIPCIFKGSNSDTQQRQNQQLVVSPLLVYQQVTLSWIKMGLGMKNSHFCSAVSNYSKPLRSSCRMEKLQCYLHFSFPLLVTYTQHLRLSLCAYWAGSVKHSPYNTCYLTKLFEPSDTLWDFLSSHFFSF